MRRMATQLGISKKPGKVREYENIGKKIGKTSGILVSHQEISTYDLPMAVKVLVIIY